MLEEAGPLGLHAWSTWLHGLGLHHVWQLLLVEGQMLLLWRLLLAVLLEVRPASVHAGLLQAGHAASRIASAQRLQLLGARPGSMTP